MINLKTVVCRKLEQIAAFFTYFFIGFFGAVLDLPDNAFGLPPDSRVQLSLLPAFC